MGVRDVDHGLDMCKGFVELTDECLPKHTRLS